MKFICFIVGVANIMKREKLWSNNYDYDGCDCRYPLNNPENLDFVKTIYKKMELIKTLKNPNISSFEKKNIIEKSEFFENTMKPNKSLGGLFTDWNFEIDS